jgi:hypothetical protein
MEKSMFKPAFNVLLGLIVGSGVLSAQTITNPDISVIPRFHVFSHDEGNGSFEIPDMSIEELEIAIQAYLNPYARADIYLAKHGDHPLEIEEAYASFLRGLPLDLNARIGKFRTEFGRFNMMHPHQWPFITAPLSAQRFLGEEGASDLGIGLSTLLPTGTLYSRLSVEVLRGGFTQTIDPREEHAEEDHEEHAHEHEGVIGFLDTLGRKPAYAFAGRLMSFFPLSDESDMEIGVSALSGVHDPHHDHRFLYTNVDLKYKWKPDAYTSLTLQGEFLLSSRTVTVHDAMDVPMEDDVTSYGAFLFADYQFLKSYTIGARYDWAQSPYSTDDKARGFAVFAGFYPVEETSAFRLEFAQKIHQRPDGDSQTVRSVTLQFLFSLGPHRAHSF